MGLYISCNAVNICLSNGSSMGRHDPLIHDYKMGLLWVIRQLNRLGLVLIFGHDK